MVSVVDRTDDINRHNLGVEVKIGTLISHHAKPFVLIVGTSLPWSIHIHIHVHVWVHVHVHVWIDSHVSGLSWFAVVCGSEG